MTTLRPFVVDDLFALNNINLDPFTETYNQPFYLNYLARWPEYFMVQEAPDGKLMGYVMGKAEGEGENWHGHVTAVTVAPEYRRLGLARRLMKDLEDVSEHHHNGYFVDLYVRVSNALAIGMYKTLGYSVYRQVIDYYSGHGAAPSEDAYDMRKALPRDVDKRSIVPLPHPVYLSAGD
jgi:N-terminal acetyltransferase B complex catalytic subunit